MEDKTRVQIVDIQVVCDRIFNFILKDLGITSIELEENLYWSLSKEAKFDMTQAPTAEYVGSLVDDFEFVRGAVTDEDQALPLLFEHVAPLLEAIATKVRNYR